MRYLIASAAALMLAACSPSADTTKEASAEGATEALTIDGTYKADVASAKLSEKPDIFAVVDGQYDCTSCTPPYKIPADGKPQPVAGRDYWDAAAVNVVDASTVEFTRFRKGAAIGTTKVQVSADGQMLTWTSTSSDNAAGKAVTNSSKSKRTAPAPAGAHATSGSWVAVNEGAQIADESLMADVSVKGDTVTMKLLTGEGYVATLGGPQVPLSGDKAGATVAVVRDGAGFKETNYVGGKAVVEFTYTPVDASTVNMTVNNLRSKTTESYTLKKQ